MDHPTSLLSIAVVSSALSPAALTAAALWGGESWAISGVEGDISVVSNGFLKSNNLQELIEVYRDNDLQQRF